jgi:hypothetical protein
MTTIDIYVLPTLLDRYSYAKIVIRNAVLDDQVVYYNFVEQCTQDKYNVDDCGFMIEVSDIVKDELVVLCSKQYKNYLITLVN